MIEFHPFFVHFPIALNVFALMLSFSSIFVDRISKFYIIVVIATGSIMTLISAYTGNAAEVQASKIQDIGISLSRHQELGNYLVWSSILSSLILIYLFFKQKLKKPMLIAVSAYLAYLSIECGYHGSILVYQFGAGTLIGK